MNFIVEIHWINLLPQAGELLKIPKNNSNLSNFRQLIANNTGILLFDNKKESLHKQVIQALYSKQALKSVAQKMFAFYTNHVCREASCLCIKF